MIQRKLVDCQSIFLDTGPIVDLLKVDFSGSATEVKERAEHCKVLIKSLCDNESSKGARRFLVSTISIAEIFHLDKKHSDITNALAIALNSDEIELIAFDEELAFFHNQNMGSFLGNKSISNLKKELSYPVGNGYIKVEERIRKDFLIAATAKHSGADIVLTTDSGFRDLCDKLNICCHLNLGEKSFVMSGNGKAVYEFNYVNA